MTNKIILTIFVLIITSASYGREIEGVDLKESIVTSDNTHLELNGAGVRSKFIFSIYVAGLYLTEPRHTAEQILTLNGEKQLRMHFVYSEVSAEKIQDGFKTGFENNLSDKQRIDLSKEISQFIAMFGTVKDRDLLVLAQLQDQSTQVSLNGKVLGNIENPQFYSALLLIWLGNEPVTEELKASLLAKKR